MPAFVTFGELAAKIETNQARLQSATPYFNGRGVQGTSVAFTMGVEWFQVGISNSQSYGLREALLALRQYPNTELNNTTTDEYRTVRWWAEKKLNANQWVMVWYNPNEL